MALEFSVKEGDRSAWPMTLKDKDGAVDLTLATTIKIYVREFDETTLSIDGGSCSTVVAASGTITYTPSAADVTALATALGTEREEVFEVEVVVTWSDATTSRFPSEGFGRLTLTESLAG